MELLISIFFVVLFIVLAFGLWANRQADYLQRQRIAADRLEGWSSGTRTPLGGRREPVRGGSEPWDRALRWSSEALAQAGLDLAPHWLLLGLAGLAVAGPILTTHWLPPAAALAVAPIVLALALLWLRSRRRRRLQMLARQLPYLLDTLRTALESGHTMLRGLQMAAQNNPEPLAGELRTIVDQVRVGMSLPLALEAMCRRVPIDELSFMADAVSVQEETGSSLAEILQHVAQSIRNRQRLDDQIKVLTSQSRMSAMIVSALPVVILGVFSMMRGDYTRILFHDPTGQRMLEVAIGLDAAAFLIMREIARVDY